MSRWNKSGSNRFQQTVVPLDNLLREKENKNSVAVGTVMKFGIMQFTSLRSSCYNMGALNSTSPIQNSASSPTSPDLNDSKISVEQTPKPRKFFKSRNSGGAAEQIALQQQMALQQQQNQSHNNHILHHQVSSDDQSSPQKQKIKTSTKKVSPKKEKKEKVEKPPKIKKEKPPKVPKVPKEKPRTESAASESEKVSPSRRNRQPIEPTRASNRARGKINYNEDLGEEEFLIRTEKRIVPKTLLQIQQELQEQQQQQQQQQLQEMSSQESVSIPSQEVEVPVPQESPTIQNNIPSSNEGASQSQAAHPPIVLRISKGTSRLVSTDNEDGIKSPHIGGNSSSDENKNVVDSSALASTDELIAVLSGDSIPQPEPETKPGRIRIRIKKDYIRSYNDSLREQEEADKAKKNEELEQQQKEQLLEQQKSKSETSSTEPSAGRVTRRRGAKIQEKEIVAPRISPIVSEFDSQSSVLGSISSQNTTISTSATSNMNQSQDCKVIHSRGSSVVTSDIDTSQQSSLAAAPPSSEHFSSNNGSRDDASVNLQQQKGRRGRKKQPVVEIEMKPPEPVVIEKPTRTRNTRNTRAQNKSPEPVASPVTTPETTPEKRSTRNTRQNNVTAQENSSPPSPASVVTTATKSTRKRKNLELPAAAVETPLNTSDDQSSVLNLSQRSTTSNSTSTKTDDTVPIIPEYKHKKLVKRSWESEKSDKSSPMEVDQAPNNAPVTRNSPNKQHNNHVQKQQHETAENSNPGVKLLISKKKGSIFKSRALDKDEDNNKKRLNLYKHTWDEDAEMTDKTNNASEKAESLNTSIASSAAGFDGEPSGITRFSRTKKPENNVKESIADDFDEDDIPLAGMNYDKNAKDYYQVVRNVKKAHQIQEIGEFQEMDDDVEYLLDALQPNSQVALRCLSALQLASKCMTPSFRMHIRAHGIVPKFFKALEDAPNDPSLGLCTAMVMFALSQDTLKMDLDRGSLELMLNLLECESADHQKQYPKDVLMNKQHVERKQKVRELCEEIQGQGKSIHLNLDNITAAQLAMESLLSLTSKRAGEWLKEDLRELGGIEHIIKTVCECCNQINEYVEEWTEPLLEKLNKIGRCLRIVENVTSNNEENQKYILHYKSQVFVRTLCKFYNLLSSELTLYPTTEKSAKDFAGVAIRETLITLLKVIVNLTHPFNERAIGSVLFGDFRDIFQISISSLLFGVSYVSSRLQFDFSLLTLVLLNNLTQLNEKNRQSIMQLTIPVEEFGKEKQPAIKSLIEYFYKCEDKAKTLKKLTDDLIDNSKQRDAKQEEAVNALIQNSGTHMENTILGSFTSTLVGFVIMNNQNNEAIARRYLRDGKFKNMVVVLMQYYEFLNLTVSADASSMAQVKTIKNVMDHLGNCDVE